MNLPNKLTLARIIAVPVFVVLYMRGLFIPAFIIFILASLTDMLDGKIARKYNLITNFGKIMDPLADKILVYSAFCLMVEDGAVPSWMLIIILLREFAVSGLRLIAAERQHVIAAAWSGKVKTTCTMVGLCFLIVFDQYPMLNNIVTAVILITTVYSGIEYFIKNWSVFKDAD